MKKGLVVSGGGSKGAWAIGFLKTMNEVEKNIENYDVYVGSSIGSIISLAIATGKFNILKEFFLSLENSDIYDVSPFKIKKYLGNGQYELGLNVLGIVWNVLIKQRISFGDTDKVLDLIKKFITYKDFQNLKKNGKTVIVIVTNLNNGEKVVVSSNNTDFETFIRFVFASTCASPIMSVYEDGNNQYVDGGFSENVPIQVAINEGCSEVDVLNLNNYDKSDNVWVTDVFMLFGKLIDIFLKNLNKQSETIGNLYVKYNDVKLKIFKPSSKLTNFPFVFEKNGLNYFYDCGIRDAIECFIRKRNFMEVELTQKGSKNFKYF